MHRLLGLMLLSSLLIFVCGCGDDKSSEPDSEIQPNLLDERIELVGYHCICWDQSLDGFADRPGRYALRMVAADYDWTQEFSISEANPSQPAWECCDTSTISILARRHTDPPEFFSFELSADRYAPGDTVSIELAIPAAADVKLQVWRIE